MRDTFGKQSKCARSQIVPLVTRENRENAVEHVDVFVHIVVEVQCSHKARKFFTVAEPPLVLRFSAVDHNSHFSQPLTEPDDILGSDDQRLSCGTWHNIHGCISS